MAQPEQALALSETSAQASQVRTAVDLSSVISLDDFQTKGEVFKLVDDDRSWLLYPL